MSWRRVGVHSRWVRDLEGRAWRARLNVTVHVYGGQSCGAYTVNYYRLCFLVEFWTWRWCVGVGWGVYFGFSDGLIACMVPCSPSECCFMVDGARVVHWVWRLVSCLVAFANGEAYRDIDVSSPITWIAWRDWRRQFSPIIRQLLIITFPSNQASRPREGTSRSVSRNTETGPIAVLPCRLQSRGTGLRSACSPARIVGPRTIFPWRKF